MGNRKLKAAKRNNFLHLKYIIIGNFLHLKYIIKCKKLF